MDLLSHSGGTSNRKYGVTLLKRDGIALGRDRIALIRAKHGLTARKRLETLHP